MSALTAEVLDEHLPKKWEIQGHLGKGGQGTVFSGSVGGTPAAIKVFHDEGDVQRVTREIRALEQVESEHVVGLLGFCTVTISGRVLQVVAYELLDGGDLSSLIENGAASREVLCEVGMHMCSALEALWSLNIVHRDVKPPNIVRTSEGRFVLVDLAFARHLDESSLTQTGWTVGTRGYMSPEHQRAWKNLTVDADVYSLGATLFELASGSLPTGQPSAAAAFLAQERHDLGPEFHGVIAAMLAHLPYERPQVRGLRETFARMLEEG